MTYLEELARRSIYNLKASKGQKITNGVLKKISKLFEIEWKDRSVLDLGCAQGRGCELVRRLGAAPVGVDFAFNRIRQARKKFPEIPFVCMNVYDFVNNVRRTKFDVVLMLDLLEHLERPDLLIEESIRIISDRGRVIAKVPLQHACHNHLQVYENKTHFDLELKPHLSYNSRDKYIYAMWRK